MTSIVTLTMNPAVDLAADTDRVEPERKLRCSAPRRDAGGGGINVARVLRRFGRDSTALYPAGGVTGDILHGLLEREGVGSVPVPIAGETRENVTISEPGTGAQYRFVLPGPELTENECRASLDRLAELAGPGFVVASGSLPPGVPPALCREVVSIAAGQGARAVVDSSGGALAAALEEGVFLVKPNLRELSDLTGRTLETESEWAGAAADLVERGAAEVVALSLGHRGAMLVSRDLRLYAPAISIEPVSAVGAGDSFVAAMVWQLDAGADLARAFAYGVAAGTAALLTPGTELCRPEDVERLSREVRLQEIGPAAAR